MIQPTRATMTGAMPHATPFTAACVQVNAGDDLDANVARASALVREARGEGADLILMPENVAMMAGGAAAIHANAMPEDGHRALAAFRELAAEIVAWLLVGSLTVRVAGEERVANRSLLLDPAGTIVARYDKIHMYDVDVPGGESHRESKNFRPGAEAVVAPTPWGRLGMTVCYDLRFARLYRALARAGADFLTIPSAFTKVTGAAHWHVLIRARAIETGSFVLAPAQTGGHPGKRQTYGHSMIVDPWGRVLAEAGEKPGVITARIDPAAVIKARAAVPALTQDRDFAPPLDRDEIAALRASA